MTGLDYYPAIRRKKLSEARLISPEKAIAIGFTLAVVVVILDITNILF